MKRTGLVTAAAVSFVLMTPALAAPALKPALEPLGFLVGNWDSGEGKVADTGAPPRAVRW